MRDVKEVFRGVIKVRDVEVNLVTTIIQWKNVDYLYLVINHVAHVVVAGHPGVVPQLGTDIRDDHVEILDTFDGGHSIDKLMDFSLLPDNL